LTAEFTKRIKKYDDDDDFHMTMTDESVKI